MSERGDDVPDADDVLVPGRAVDDLEVVLVGWRWPGTSVVSYLAPSLLLPLAQAQLACPDVTEYVPVPPCDVTVLLRHRRARVVHVEVAQLRRAGERAL